MLLCSHDSERRATLQPTRILAVSLHLGPWLPVCKALRGLSQYQEEGGCFGPVFAGISGRGDRSGNPEAEGCGTWAAFVVFSGVLTYDRGKRNEV